MTLKHPADSETAPPPLSALMAVRLEKYAEPPASRNMIYEVDALRRKINASIGIVKAKKIVTTRSFKGGVRS